MGEMSLCPAVFSSGAQEYTQDFRWLLSYLLKIFLSSIMFSLSLLRERTALAWSAGVTNYNWTLMAGSSCRSFVEKAHQPHVAFLVAAI